MTDPADLGMMKRRLDYRRATVSGLLGIAFWWCVWAMLRAFAVLRPLRIIGERGIGPQPNPLFLRWFLSSRPRTPTETGTPGWYLHNYRRPDLDRREHNHPWKEAHTIVLRGGYVETRDGIRRTRLPGDHAAFDRETFHRITAVLPGTWTLFYAGPKHGRGWGFRG